MKNKKMISILAATALLGITAAGCSSGEQASSPAASGTSNAPKEKFIFWDKGEYTQAYNDLMKQRVEEFGKANNIEAEYVVVSQNDLKTKLLAAIEAKNPPDLIVANDPVAKQFVASDQLVDASDIITKINFTEGSKKFVVVKDKYFMVPQSYQMGGAYLRKDLWEKHNLSVPKTWQELYEQAKIVNDPKNGIYAVGFPLGQSGGGDAEGMVRDVIIAYGGAIVDKDNNIVVNSKETLEAITFMSKFWKEGLSPTSSVTWDDNGNNNAYLAGTVGFIINSGSVYDQAKKEKPELEKNTLLIPKLAGPKGEFILGSGNVFAIFKNAKGTKWAKKFVTEFYDKDFYNKFVEVMGGKFQPVLKGSEEAAFWKDPNNKAAGWMKMIDSVVGSSNYPGPEDDLGSKAKSSQLATRAVQRVVVEKMDPQKSLDQLEQELKQLYGKK
ncbi:MULTISPECIES: ABC transporter substrate-binding protein [unclassified Paenibacillus]|uniref:ABC transporter substrate-binding protein n=1 Tax=unclassified Paenibacillus TaxID=185978 RepID=UPI00362B4E8C